jgi:hypothetical protein
MTNKQQLIAAITLFLSILWGMAYFMSQLPEDHWAAFPAFVTAVLGMMGSVVWAVESFYLIKE